MADLFTDLKKKIITITLFAFAMGYLETAVVVYMRLLYYPRGFSFPLVIIPDPVMRVELLREVATIIMLLTLSIVSGKNNLQRFLFFLYTFAVWDITYYLWLKILLGWPDSFLTWDLLFLIPVPWASPLLAPLICSLTMILFSGLLLRLQSKGCEFNINKNEWILTIAGALIILFSFMRDYLKIALYYLKYESSDKLLAKEHLSQAVAQYIPADFSWIAFITGEAFILVAIFLIVFRVKRSNNSSNINNRQPF